MLFRQLFDSDTCTYTYLLASGQEAIIIDPVKEQLPVYLRLINELDIQLVAALDTHVHADHITAMGSLCHETDCLSVMGAETKADAVAVRLQDDEAFTFGDMRLKALYTPGHTDDSYSFLLNDRVFTGDTLLIRGTGRTDFQNGDSYAQYDSLMNKLLTLPKGTLVYPAHDYRGQTVSTIGEEKAFNPRLQVSSADEYADLMANLNLPKPKYMDVAVPANLRIGL
jgi:glyoxylase-like metal-dependent hydrolase (beta-lactamase superfamily II)